MEALTEVESEVIEVEDFGEEQKESYLVGRLVTHKNWNPCRLIRAMKKAWKPKNGISWRVLEGSKLILFCFDDAIERDWVLKNQPWVYKRSLFAIKEFTEELLSSSTNATIDHAAFWARLYDVPISCMNERSLRLFAKKIGTLESVDISDEDLFGKFVRFKISMNITKPLMRGITIRAKGKHFWLPLKYESLPIYCLSCGTIGHDINNCQSLNRNLKYGSSELRVFSWKGRNKVEDSPTLPQDIIEIILSHVPVKYLLRFKVVCKQWRAIISDAQFAERHLQQSKKSSSTSLIAREEWQDFKGFNVSELTNNHFHFLSAIEHSSKYSSTYGILCCCDGLYLNCYKDFDGTKAYVLWNPSCRAYLEVRCPKQINDSHQSRRALYGIYYNPLVRDYKVVIADTKHYAVFSIGHNKWSEVKEVKGVRCHGSSDSGVSCDGSFYWPLTHRRRSHIVEFDIIQFDWKDEKFKNLTPPEFKGKPHMFNVTCCGGHLCLLYNSRPDEMWIVKRGEGDSWMEFKVQFNAPYRTPFPRCWLSEDELLLDFPSMPNFLLYNLPKNTFMSIPKHRHTRGFDCPLPYVQNLFLQDNGST